jgi:hypothetical protein
LEAALIGVLFAMALAASAITDLHPVELHPGVNVVHGFGPNGEDVTIVQAWRENGNAHGYNVWLVLSPGDRGDQNVIDIDDRGGLPRDLIRDDPFDGERTLGVVAFATAKIDGVTTSLLIDAHLDDAPSGVLADHVTATIKIYRLMRNPVPVGTINLFDPIAEIHTQQRYCNIYLALRDSLGLALPVGGEGPVNNVDGCY